VVASRPAIRMASYCCRTLMQNWRKGWSQPHNQRRSDQAISDLPAGASAFHVRLHQG
jgi:hypothetical protein